MKQIWIITALVGVLVMIGVATAEETEKLIITLHNGAELSFINWERQDHQYCADKYGGVVCFSDKEIASVRKEKADVAYNDTTKVKAVNADGYEIIDGIVDDGTNNVALGSRSKAWRKQNEEAYNNFLKANPNHGTGKRVWVK